MCRHCLGQFGYSLSTLSLVFLFLRTLCHLHLQERGMHEIVLIFLIFICHRLSRAVYCLFELSDHAIDLFSQSSGLLLIRFILKQYSSSYSQLYDKAYLRNHPGHMTDIFNLRIEFVESIILNHKRGKELLIMDYLQ